MVHLFNRRPKPEVLTTGELSLAAVERGGALDKGDFSVLKSRLYVRSADLDNMVRAHEEARDSDMSILTLITKPAKEIFQKMFDKVADRFIDAVEIYPELIKNCDEIARLGSERIQLKLIRVIEGINSTFDPDLIRVIASLAADGTDKVKIRVIGLAYTHPEIMSYEVEKHLSDPHNSKKVLFALTDYVKQHPETLRNVGYEMTASSPYDERKVKRRVKKVQLRLLETISLDFEAFKQHSFATFFRLAMGDDEVKLGLIQLLKDHPEILLKILLETSLWNNETIVETLASRKSGEEVNVALWQLALTDDRIMRLVAPTLAYNGSKRTDFLIIDEASADPSILDLEYVSHGGNRATIKQLFYSRYEPGVFDQVASILRG